MNLSLLGYVQFPCSVSEIPCFDGQGIRRERLEFVRECASSSAFLGLKHQNFPVFSRKTGNTQTETGSPMTASTASFLFWVRSLHPAALEIWLVPEAD
jgi:hypothetical protein